MIRPYILVLAGPDFEITLKAVRECGADYVLKKGAKGYGPEQVLGILRLMSQFFDARPNSGAAGDAVPARPSRERLHKALSRELNEIGVTPNLKGHDYILCAVELMIDGCDRNVTRCIYPAVAEKFDTPHRNVERNIRSAIEAAWNTTQGKIKERYFPQHSQFSRGNPTNKQFLCCLAERFRDFKE